MCETKWTIFGPASVISFKCMHNSGPHVCLVVTNDFVANESLRESRTCGAASASDVVAALWREGGQKKDFSVVT